MEQEGSHRTSECTPESFPRFTAQQCTTQRLDLQVWEAIDAHMDDRRRAIREKKLKEDIEKYRKENPKITEQFADLKRKLAHISEDEWNAIPDIGDYTRHKKNKMDVGPVDTPPALSWTCLKNSSARAPALALWDESALAWDASHSRQC